MQDEVSIRRFRREDEADAVRLLVRKQRSEERDKAFERRLARWKWQYYRNPSNTGSEPILWVAESKGVLAGLVCPLAVRLRTPAGLVGASWCNDWIVDAAHRGTGLGKALEEAWIGTYPVALGRGWSDRAYVVSLRVGLVAVGGFSRLYFPLSPVAYALALRRGRQHRRLARLIQAVPRMALARPACQQVRVEVGTSLPAGTDALWQRVSACYPFAVERDSAHLRWRYEQHPSFHYRFLSVADGSVLKGLAVAHTSEDDPPLGVLSDLIVDPRDPTTVAALVEESVRALKAEGACVMIADVPPKLLPSVLGTRRAYFAEEIKILVSRGRTHYGEQSMFDAANWYLALGDSDIDF